MTTTPKRILIATGCLLLVTGFALATAGSPEISNPEPVILVCAGMQNEVADSLAKILSSDPRIPGKVQLVTSTGSFKTLLLFPQVAVGVVMCTSSGEAETVRDACISFFQQGGGLVGFFRVADTHEAGDMARDVFPFFGNVTVDRSAGHKHQTYVVHDVVPGLNDNISSTFVLPGESVSCVGSAEGSCLPHKGAGLTLYEDAEIGCPLVLAYEAEAGGRSVGFSACSVKAYSGAENHYSLLVNSADFSELLRKSVAWCLEGSERFSDLCSDANARVESYLEDITELRTSSEDARRKARSTQNTMIVLLWTAGLSCSFVIARRSSFTREGANEKVGGDPAH